MDLKIARNSTERALADDASAAVPRRDSMESV